MHAGMFRLTHTHPCTYMPMVNVIISICLGCFPVHRFDEKLKANLSTNPSVLFLSKRIHK